MPVAIEHYVPQCAPGAAGTTRTRAAWLVWGLTVIGAFALLGLIVGAPLAQAQGHETFALIAYRAFDGLCHQLPTRSFYLAGQPLAVCARCCGIYAGFAAGALCYPLVRPLGRACVPARRWLLLAALPTCVDFALGYTGLWANTHTSRALTGALLGAGLICFVLPCLLELGRGPTAEHAAGRATGKQRATALSRPLGRPLPAAHDAVSQRAVNL